MKHLDKADAAQALKDKHESGELVDNHQFEHEARKHFETAFALNFLEYIAKPDPLHSFSLRFGQWIQQRLSGQIAPTQKVSSPNLRKDNTENQQWRIL